MEEQDSPKSWSKQTRPETIEIDGDVLVRNDILAKQEGVHERTINRRERLGAPFVLIGNVKYRPHREYRAFLASLVQRKNQPRGKAAR